jgi:acylphosphatase
MSPSTVRAHLWVVGRVQGVSFRAFTQDEARQRGLTGGVRNLPDGSVEVEVEGDRQAVEALIARIRRGPGSARVDAVEVQWEQPTGLHGDFRIWY